MSSRSHRTGGGQVGARGVTCSLTAGATRNKVIISSLAFIRFLSHDVILVKDSYNKQLVSFECFDTFNKFNYYNIMLI